MMDTSTNTSGSMSTALLLVAWIGFGMSSTVVGLRLWVRFGKLRQHLAMHDYLMTAALFCLGLTSILLTVGCHFGLGQHSATLTEQQNLTAGKITVFAEPWMIIAPMFGRLAVCALILTILDASTRAFCRGLLWAIVAIQIVENLIIVIELYAQCGSHPAALWNPFLPHSKYCISTTFETVMAYLSSAFNSLSDLVLTAVPAMVLLKLRMNKRTKFALVALFATSLFAFAISIVKAIQNARLTEDDFTWSITFLQIYVSAPNAAYHPGAAAYTAQILVECDVIIITGSLPTLRPLWQRPVTTRQAPLYRGHVMSQETRVYASAGHNEDKARTTRVIEAVGDGTSEEYILESGPGNNIVLVTDVNVTYDRARSLDAREAHEEALHPRGW